MSKRCRGVKQIESRRVNRETSSNFLKFEPARAISAVRPTENQPPPSPKGSAAAAEQDITTQRQWKTSRLRVQRDQPQPLNKILRFKDKSTTSESKGNRLQPLNKKNTWRQTNNQARARMNKTKLNTKDHSVAESSRIESTREKQLHLDPPPSSLRVKGKMRKEQPRDVYVAPWYQMNNHTAPSPSPGSWTASESSHTPKKDLDFACHGSAAQPAGPHRGVDAEDAPPTYTRTRTWRWVGMTGIWGAGTYWAGAVLESSESCSYTGEEGEAEVVEEELGVRSRIAAWGTIMRRRATACRPAPCAETKRKLKERGIARTRTRSDPPPANTIYSLSGVRKRIATHKAMVRDARRRLGPFIRPISREEGGEVKKRGTHAYRRPCTRRWCRGPSANTCCHSVVVSSGKEKNGKEWGEIDESQGPASSTATTGTFRTTGEGLRATGRRKEEEGKHRYSNAEQYFSRFNPAEKEKKREARVNKPSGGVNSALAPVICEL
ncbi:hypothetical protein B0H11DRAFT_1907788 [Mycena galericulata]|nr:hypothetical protein B0H11DRAFT_1907788 [Mycena galericulata]